MPNKSIDNSNRLAITRSFKFTHYDMDGNIIDRCFFIHGFPPANRYHGKNVKPKGKKLTNLLIISNVNTKEIKQSTTMKHDQIMALLRKDTGN